MGIDVEGLMWLVNQYEIEHILVDSLMADAIVHEIDACHMRAVLQQALDTGRLEWVDGESAVRRPA